MQRISIKKYFLFLVGSEGAHKVVLMWVEKHGKHFSDNEEVETEVQKRLRQQSKDFYAAGFDTLVIQWYECINVGGGYVEK
jgi:hypothetical protein